MITYLLFMLQDKGGKSRKGVVLGDKTWMNR